MWKVPLLVEYLRKDKENLALETKNCRWKERARGLHADHRSFPNIRVYEITRNEYSARASASRNERRIFSTDERKDIAAALIELVTAIACVDYANVWN